MFIARAIALSVFGLHRDQQDLTLKTYPHGTFDDQAGCRFSCSGVGLRGSASPFCLGALVSSLSSTIHACHYPGTGLCPLAEEVSFGSDLACCSASAPMKSTSIGQRVTAEQR